MSLSSRLYRGLVSLYPRAFRDAFGREMAESFEAMRDETRREGRRGAVVRFWIRIGVDFSTSFLREHHAALTRGGSSSRHRSTDMSSFVLDLRCALRNLERHPAVTALLVGMLALGVAGNMAAFSVVNGLLLRPLPYPEPDRLVYLNEKAPSWNLDIVGIDFQDFYRWRDENRTFDGMAVFATQEFNFASGSEAERISGAQVTHDLAPLLGVTPVLGRNFLPEDDRPGAPKVVVMGERLWESRFGKDPSLLGKSLTLDGEPYTLVGVVTLDDAGIQKSALWVPLSANPHPEFESYYLDGIGRMKKGVGLEDARTDLAGVQQRIVESKPQKAPVAPLVLPYRDPFVKDIRTAAFLLWGAVGVVFVIACVNVASVLLARAAARRREMALRRALGAGIFRLLRQLLAEGFVLSLAGGLSGTILGLWVLELLLARAPREMPPWMDFSVDLRVVSFCVAVSIVAPILFSLIPALYSWRVDLRGALDTGGRGLVGRTRSLDGLVIVETALAVLLLVSAGLLGKTFRELNKVDPGFHPENTLSFTLSLPESKYAAEQWAPFYEDVLNRLRVLPGVESAAAINLPPLGGHWGVFFEAEGAPPKRPGEIDPVILLRIATPGYLRTLGIALLSGRDISKDDKKGSRARVMVVNEEFARLLWPGESPLGKRARRGRAGKGDWFTVVGIVRDVKHYGVDREMRPGVYVPYAQAATTSPEMTVVLKTRVEPLGLVDAVRRVVKAIDPTIPLFGVTTFTERLERSLKLRATYAWLFGAFAAVALALAMGGIYGVLSYAVGRRTQEIGIRMAVGAERRQVLKLFLRRGMGVVLAGVLLGVALSLLSTRLLASLLFGVKPEDPTTYASVALAVVGAALLATLPPAWRGASLPPTIALQRE